jgi:hypothetical protein
VRKTPNDPPTYLAVIVEKGIATEVKSFSSYATARKSLLRASNQWVTKEAYQNHTLQDANEFSENH